MMLTPKDLLDSSLETIDVKCSYEGYSDLSIYFFPNGRGFDENDYEYIIEVYLEMTGL